MNIFTDHILEQCKPIFDSLAEMSDEMRIDLINSIRLELHKLSPMQAEPVDCVIWVKSDLVTANDYNPNSVAPPEMKLLAHSIIEDGYTQPIVAWDTGGQYEVVDGYHRNRVGRENPEVRERVKGYLPLAVINALRTDRNDRIAATIRHNRARGKHRIDGMSEIVVELKRRNWSDEKIGRELGMDPDEVLRLTQITGLAEMFADRDFSQAWEAEESNEINPEDTLSINEENLSSLPVVGGLARGDVPGDSAIDTPVDNRCSGPAAENADSPHAGDATSDTRMAHSHGDGFIEPGEESSSMAGTIGLFSLPPSAGLSYETSMAHSHRKPAGRSKRSSRFGDTGVL